MYWIVGLVVGVLLAFVWGCAGVGGSIHFPVGKADVSVGVDEKGGLQVEVDPQDKGAQ